MPLLLISVQDIGVRYHGVVGVVGGGKLYCERRLVVAEHNLVGILERAFKYGRIKVPQLAVYHLEACDERGVARVVVVSHRLRIKRQQALAAAYKYVAVLQAYRCVVLYVHLRKARKAVVALQKRRAGAHACQSVLGAYPQAVALVLHDRRYYVAALFLVYHIRLKHGLPALLVIIFDLAEAAAEYAHPYISLVVFVHREDVVSHGSRPMAVAVGLKLYVRRPVELSVERHQSVCRAHPHSAVAVFGYRAHVGVEVVARISAESVVPVSEYGLAAPFLNEVESAVECAHPYTSAAVLISEINAVAAQRVAVAAPVGVSCYAQSLRSHGVGRCLYQSGALCREPVVAPVVFHYVIHRTNFAAAEPALYVVRSEVHAEQLALACANPQVAVARLIHGTYAVVVALVAADEHARKHKPEVVVGEAHLIYATAR